MAKAPTFEQALQALEDAVDLLERGQLPLNEALACFERGVSSASRCRELLGEVEGRVDVLLKNSSGRLSLTPLDEGGPEGGRG